MKITSRFNLEQITIGDFKLIESGTLICHKNELIFHFQGFIMKMEFLTDITKQSTGAFELDSKTIPATLKCYNFNNALSSSTTEPFEIAKYTPGQQQITSLGSIAQPQEEVLYIAFSIVANGTTKVINYNFYIKNRLVPIGQ